MSRLLRKCSRKYVVLSAVAVLLLFLVSTHLFDDLVQSDLENDLKVQLIEKAIQSPGNHGQCRIPDLPLHSPEIDQFLHTEPPLQCEGKHEDWVRCRRTRCYAQPRPLAEHFQLHCSFVDIVRRSDHDVEEARVGREFTFKGAADYFELLDSDVARVKCKSSRTGERWTGVVIGVRKNLGRRLLQRPLQDYRAHLPFSVLILGFDSLSRNAFIRKLPKSYAFLTQQLGAHVLRGYNIVGDGTPQALIPLLTGHTELELPDTRRRKPGSVACDAFPMLWRFFRRGGYVTSFNEDLPDVGTFTYRLNGFHEQPTDHYMRTYFLASAAQQQRYARLCTGDQPRHRLFLNHTLQLLQGGTAEWGAPKFIFSFHGELSHDSVNLIGVADDDLLLFLREFARLHLQNTLLVLMSDHGNRFADLRNTFQGKLEERLPFFSFAFPDEFRRAFPAEHAAFAENAAQGRLVTPFDINRSLRHLLELQRGEAAPGPPNAKHPTRALSLFAPISANRSCADAYIEPHWCSCLRWTELSPYDNRAVRAAVATVEHVNNLTLNYRALCEQLHVERIEWAASVAPSEDLVQFQGSADRDGYVGGFDGTKRARPLYQVKVVTKPGGGVYEATLEHDLALDTFRADAAHISRANKYGEQANCIYGRDPELRKFCYCK